MELDMLPEGRVLTLGRKLSIGDVQADELAAIIGPRSHVQEPDFSSCPNISDADVVSIRNARDDLRLQQRTTHEIQHALVLRSQSVDLLAASRKDVCCHRWRMSGKSDDGPGVVQEMSRYLAHVISKERLYSLSAH